MKIDAIKMKKYINKDEFTKIEYETKQQIDMRMVVDLIRELRIDAIIEGRKALKC